MKFCPQCGSQLNGEIVCKACGFNIETQLEEAMKNPTYLNDYKNSICNHEKEIKDKIVPLEELKKDRLNYDNTKKIIYSSSSISMGDIYSCLLDFDNKELTCVSFSMFYGPVTTKKYRVDENVLERVKSILNENNMARWMSLDVDYASTKLNNRKDMDILIGETNYRIVHQAVMSDEEEKIFIDLENYIKSQALEENKISEETKPNEQISYNPTFMG